MKIMFVYRNVMGMPYLDFGLMSLSAYIKENGHETKLLDFTFGKNIVEVEREVKKFSPDLIGFSAKSNDFEEIVKTATKMRKFSDAVFICGGIHPTINPLDSLRECFDGICVGEGEEALLELVERIENGKRYYDIKNFWFNVEGKIIKNDIRPLVENLDSLPPMDYELFDIEKYLKSRNGEIDYMASRGCPFSCTYCVNHILQKTYQGKGRYARMKSIDAIVLELSILKKKYNFSRIYFGDETFNLSENRLKEFSEKYKLDVPFDCCLRADLCTENGIKYLKEAGCRRVSIAIETGDEGIRKNLLKKNISDKQLINSFRLAKKYGLKTLSLNMIGLPNESESQILKTIKMNELVESDSIQVSIFTPFFSTELRKICEEQNMIVDNDITSYYLQKPIKNPNLSEKEILKYYRWFSYLCYRKRSKGKAILLLLRDMIIPLYLKYTNKTPIIFKNMIYRLFWDNKTLNFMSK